MKTFIGVESSSGGLIVVAAKNKEEAYHIIGNKIYNMPDPVDTGNVDVDLFEIPSIALGEAQRL